MKRRVLNPRITRLGSIADRFDPNAYDGDGDGLVQDATRFERPAKPKTSGRMSDVYDSGYDPTDPASPYYDESEKSLIDIGEEIDKNPDLLNIIPDKTPEAIARLSGQNMDIFNRRRMRNVEPSGHYSEQQIKDVVSSIRVEIADDGIAMIIATPPDDMRAIIPTNWDYANVRLPSTDERIKIYKEILGYLENPPPGADEIEYSTDFAISDDSAMFEDIFENEVQPLLDADYEYKTKLIKDKKITRLGSSLQFDEMIERHMRMPERGSIIDAYQDAYLQAVHDQVGHIGTGRAFDRHGEFANFLALIDLFESRAETKAEREAIAYWWFTRIFTQQLMLWEEVDVNRKVKNSEEALRLIRLIREGKSAKISHISRDIMRRLWGIDDPKTYAAKGINKKQMPIEKINKLSLAYLHSMIDNGFPKKTNRVHDSFGLGKPMRKKIQSKTLPFKKTISQRFDANAQDGDGDGLVQDNTAFQRPAKIRTKPQQSGSMGADDTDKTIASMYQNGDTLNDISVATGLSYNDVKTRIRRLQRQGNIESRSKRVRKWIPSDDEQQIMNMFFVEGLKPEQIAKDTNIPREKIDRTIKYARKQGYKKSGNKPLDKIDNEILKLWNDGYLEKEILEEVGINNDELQNRLENLSNQKLITTSKRDRKLAPPSMTKNEELILRAYDSGRSIREISRATGMTPLTIQDVLNTFRRKDSEGKYSIERARSTKKPSQSGKMQIARNRQQATRTNAVGVLVNDLIDKRRKKITKPSQSGSMAAPFNPELKRDKKITDYIDDPQLDLSEEEISQSIDYIKYALHHEFNPDGTKRTQDSSPVTDEDNFKKENHPIYSYDIETGKPVTILAMNLRFSDLTVDLINNGFNSDKEPKWLRESVRLNGRVFDFEGALSPGELEILSYMGWEKTADDIGRQPVEVWKLSLKNPLFIDWDKMKRRRKREQNPIVNTSLARSTPYPLHISEVALISEIVDSLGGEDTVKKLAQQIVDRGHLIGEPSMVIPKRESVFEIIANYKNIRELKGNDFRFVAIELAREAGYDSVIERAFNEPYTDMALIRVLDDKRAEFLGVRPKFSEETLQLVGPSTSGSMAADRGRKFKPLDNLDRELIQLYNQGASRKEIRSQLSIDANDLSNRISSLQRRGLIGSRSVQRGVDVENKPKLRRQTGANNKNPARKRKLSVARQVSQLERIVVAAYRSGKTVEQIAKAAGISRMQVQQIIMDFIK